MNQRKESAAGALLALEMEINIIEEDLEVLNLDLEFLKNLKDQFDYNKNFLKKEKVIASIIEYKRVLSDLRGTNEKIRKILNKINFLNKEMDKKLDALEYYTKQYAMEADYLSRKVLPFERSRNE